MFDSVQKHAALIARDGLKVRRLIGRCHKLLSERGEAAGVSLARETLALYRELDRKEQARFFLALATEFSPDPQKVLAAAQAYAQDGSAEHLAQLNKLAEPPRQELLRRLNRAPGGMAAIVKMRERLLQLLKEHPELAAVDWDFHHLLSSWFNPGFLQIIRVDWRTPAYLLEQIIAHEAVHEIQGWNDLHRRLEADRRCFAFFHPALPDEPLIFVEVALVEAMSEKVAPLLAVDAPSGDPRRATTAVFYSISNCQPGLRGVSLGNFLIKQVVDLLSAEFPRLKRFCTLSPIPGFVGWLTPLLKEPDAIRRPKLAQAAQAAAQVLGADPVRLAADPATAFERLEPLKEVLMQLCATYLIGAKDGEDPTPDPVARFHLNNGARLERLNWAADTSKKGLRQSLGMMVNYVYEPGAIERNHEQFVHGKIVAAKQVRALAFTS